MDSLEKALSRMLLEWGPAYASPGSGVPVHTNSAGLSKSIDWETGVLLKNFVEFYQPETIIELGTFKGYSTAWLILASLLNERNHGIQSHVHAYEVFNEGEYGPMWYDTFELSKERFTYHAIPGGIWMHADEVPESIDLIFHDTQHLLGPTIFEMDLLLPRLSSRGLVLIDDMLHPDYPSMQAYFHKIFAKHPQWDWTVLPLGHGLGIARYKP